MGSELGRSIKIQQRGGAGKIILFVVSCSYNYEGSAKGHWIQSWKTSDLSKAVSRELLHEIKPPFTSMICLASITEGVNCLKEGGLGDLILRLRRDIFFARTRIFKIYLSQEAQILCFQWLQED